MNGLISDKLHELEDDNKVDEKNENEIANIIFDKIDINFHILNPKKLLGIFFDGVSPKAKMNLQRQRRIREFYKYNNKCSFKFNSISAGTEFMENISKIIQEKIQKKKEEYQDSTWKNIKVIFSGPDVPGEAEYKIFEYIKENKNLSSNNFPFEKRCIYTTDSDFYLLSLALHKRNILLYNEYNNRFSNPMKKCFFSIDKFRRFILELFPNTNNEEKNKIIDDFICLCFLTESNYLPGVHDVLLDDIIKVYKENYKTIGFINENGKLNEKKLKKFFILLKKEVNPINKMIYYLDNEMNNNSSSNNNQNTTKSTEDDDNNNIIKFGI